eukprot:scaffold15509_cov66-Phaeocystis_antarctica.AAC.3
MLGISPGIGMLPTPPGMAPFPSGKGMPPGMGIGGKPMPSALAACRGGPPASVLASTLSGSAACISGARTHLLGSRDAHAQVRARPAATRAGNHGKRHRRAVLRVGRAATLGHDGLLCLAGSPVCKASFRVALGAVEGGQQRLEQRLDNGRHPRSGEHRAPRRFGHKFSGRRHETDKLAGQGCVARFVIRRKDRSRKPTSRVNRPRLATLSPSLQPPLASQSSLRTEKASHGSPRQVSVR